MSHTAPRRRRVHLVPSRADLVDAGFVVALGMLALLGFRTTFTGQQYLAVAAAGLVLGVLIGYLAVALRAPWITVVVMAVVAFFLLGGAIALRPDAVGGVVPTLRTWTGLADLSINGWKQLLTTLPPVDGSGPLLTIPYILGLLGGSGAFTLARRTPRTWPPVVVAVLLLAAVVLLGATRPAAELVQGALFAAIAFAWLGVRNTRRRPVTGRGAARTTRFVTAVLVLAVAGGVAVVLGPVLPGGDQQRTVLRGYVTPPFDVGQYASPLVGFRKYTEHANLAWNQTLMTVQGLPAGQPLRFATLDGYDGSVWGATNGTSGVVGDPPDSFQRVGSRIDTGATGRSTTYTVTIAGYADYVDAKAWVPSAGTVSGVTFDGPRAATLDDGFRFNLATNSGITSALLDSGDRVTLTSTLDTPTVTPSDTAAGGPTVSPAQDAFTSSAATKLAGRDPSTGIARLLVIGAKMAHDGAYSDGGQGEEIYLPGHSVFRLLTFLNRPQLVGTDEHYAATFALMANQLGIPARVVLGAVPESDGTVKGKDVHAWVEVRIARAGSGQATWATVPDQLFMPDRSKKPTTQPPVTSQDKAAAVVPPPTVSKPLSSLDQAAQVAANSQRLARKNAAAEGGFPAWIAAALKYGGSPIVFVLLVAGGIVGAKGWRRRRRRGRKVVADRYGAGWLELLDTLRDLGVPPPVGQTRREQARALARPDATRIAGAADGGVFGPTDPTEGSTSQFWAEVDAARAAALQNVGRWRRLRATLSLRSFLPRRA